MKSSMTPSDTQRDEYNSCEDSPDEKAGQVMWSLKIKF